MNGFRRYFGLFVTAVWRDAVNTGLSVCHLAAAADFES